MKAFKIKKLYTGVMGQSFDNVVVIVDEEVIKNVVLNSEFEAMNREGNIDVVDYSEYYMMPGLIDCHVHLMFPGNNTWGNIFGEYFVRDWAEGEINIMAYRNAMTALSQGITTLRDCGTLNNAALNVKNSIKNQRIVGPDILTCGAPLTCTGGHCAYMGGEADGPWEIRKKIREQQKAGADFVKLMGTYGGTMGVTKTLTFSDEEVQAAIDEAHLRGMKIAIHSCTFDMTEKLSKMNVDTIEHTVLCTADSSKNILDEEVVQRIVDRNIYVDHTICCVKGQIESLGRLVEAGTASFAERESYNSYINYDKLTVESFRFQVERGVPYIVGTDAGWRAAGFKEGYYDNLYVMEHNGADSMELLHASTLRSAVALGIDKTVGSIEAGKQADMLLLKKDPADSIAEAIKKPDFVIKKGKVVSYNE